MELQSATLVAPSKRGRSVPVWTALSHRLVYFAFKDFRHVPSHPAFSLLREIHCFCLHPQFLFSCFSGVTTSCMVSRCHDRDSWIVHVLRCRFVFCRKFQFSCSIAWITKTKKIHLRACIVLALRFTRRNRLLFPNKSSVGTPLGRSPLVCCTAAMSVSADRGQGKKCQKTHLSSHALWLFHCLQ